MSIKEIKREVFYYAGIVPTDDEACEIYDMMQFSPNADLSAIIADYYGC